MSPISSVIDLPVSPLHSTAREGDLHNAPVLVTLLDGKTLTGRLIGLDGPQGMLTLLGRNNGRLPIRFSELRHLDFLTKHPVSHDRHPLEQHPGEVVMPGPSQEFRIIFNDGKTLIGRTRGSFVDEIGIHLFKYIKHEEISRLFIPAQVVKKYYIGQGKPEEFLKRRPQAAVPPPPAAAAAAAAKPPAPKRRKSDSTKIAGMRNIATSPAHLEQALEGPERQPDHLRSGRRIGEMLVEEGVITPEQLTTALAIQGRDSSRKIGEILVDTGSGSSEAIYMALAHKFGMPFVLLRKFFIEIPCLQLVPADVARKYMLIPLLVHKDRLVVAMDDPVDTEAITLLRFITQYKIEPTIATREDLAWAIEKYYGAARPAVTKAPAADRSRPTPTATDDQPSMARAVASFVSNTVLDAIERNASDIHLIPTVNHANLLFRIDGNLVPIRRISRILMPSIIKRFAVMCDMATPLADAPVRGSTCLLSGDTAIELRVTLNPDGLRDGVIIRILNAVARLGTIADTGLDSRDQRTLMEMLGKSHRLILFTGVSNSGISSTLYAALRELQALKYDIATIETPVRYYINGIEQVQGREAVAALGQLKALKPRVAMIDNLDDPAALQGAAECALNGSLVLGRLHAPSAAGAIGTAMARGISLRLLDSTLVGVIARHPLRLNCLSCATEEIVEPALRQATGVSADEVFYRGQGCPQCNHSGYSGHSAIFEVMRVTPEIHALIRGQAPVAAIHRQAVADGMSTLFGNALNLARARKTSLAEVHRLMLESGSRPEPPA